MKYDSDFSLLSLLCWNNYIYLVSITLTFYLWIFRTNVGEQHFIFGSSLKQSQHKKLGLSKSLIYSVGMIFKCRHRYIFIWWYTIPVFCHFVSYWTFIVNIKVLISRGYVKAKKDVTSFVSLFLIFLSVWRVEWLDMRIQFVQNNGGIMVQ